MQRACHPWATASLLSGRPDVGALMSLCEENFTFMGRLAPGLRHYRGELVSRQRGAIDLHLEIQEQARYTTQVRLTHIFVAQGCLEPRPDPDACLRVYHDARQVEVLNLKQSVLPLRKDYAHPALADKWQANLFLSKWLFFCLRQGHRFGQRPASGLQSAPDVPPTPCFVRS
ncbi:DUF1249 domain-containing protein [Thiocystis violacea]|uniref:DUF1249 domain-containing protein n=1 Tax=Thiocystis violacea TaxID=13725 RepID=UPI0019067C73|nr:DUF1249 domain-containing protein [Thiocystis violacea]MBK1717809.1 hypothetical protein [Thiocystis violacea]